MPLFQRLGLGAVLGFLVAGAVIGPWGLGFISAVEEIRHLAEFGVVFLLFVIGIELKPSRLRVMRRSVFGLGTAQVLTTGTVITLAAVAFEVPMRSALIIGFGLALSSTASPPSKPIPTSRNHVIVGGFGRYGKQLTRQLAKAGIPYLVLEINPARVARAQALDYPVFYGDASRVLAIKKDPQSIQSASIGSVTLATDDPVHGCQEGRFFHGYYRHHCFLPLYVFAAINCWSAI